MSGELGQPTKGEVVSYVLDKVQESRGGTGIIVGREKVIIEIFSAMKDLPAMYLYKVKRYPHPFIQFSNLFCLYFRPPGQDGMALRGIRVKTFGLIFMTPNLSQEIMHAFYRSIEPGCEIKKIDIPE